MREPAFSVEEPPAKRPIRQLLLIGSAALILAVINAQWVTGLPAAARASTAGVGLDEPPPWSPQEPGRVVRVAMGGPAARAGLRKKDQVQAINGIPNWSYHGLHQLLDNTRAGDSLEYTVLRGTQTRVVTLRLDGRLGRIWVDLLCNACAVAIFFGAGVIVYWKHPRDRRARTFFWMCLPFALMFSQANITGVKQSDFVGPPALADGIIKALPFFLFPPLLHFTLIFPKPRPVLAKYPGILGWVYALPALIAFWIVFLILSARSMLMNPIVIGSIIQALFEPAHGRRLASVAAAIGLLAPAAFLIWKCLRSAFQNGWRSMLLTRPGLVISAFFFIPLMFGLALTRLLAAFASPMVSTNLGLIAIGIALLLELIGALLPQLIIPVAACVSLFRNSRGAGTTEKQQLRWPLWGTVTAVTGFLLLSATLIVVAFIGPASVGGWWLSALFLVLIPISFGFAITKYRLMDDFPAAETPLADARFTASSA